MNSVSEKAASIRLVQVNEGEYGNPLGAHHQLRSPRDARGNVRIGLGPLEGEKGAHGHQRPTCQEKDGGNERPPSFRPGLPLLFSLFKGFGPDHASRSQVIDPGEDERDGKAQES